MMSEVRETSSVRNSVSTGLPPMRASWQWKSPDSLSRSCLLPRSAAACSRLATRHQVGNVLVGWRG